jgi:hypothetical protein
MVSLVITLSTAMLPGAVKAVKRREQEYERSAATFATGTKHGKRSMKKVKVTKATKEGSPVLRREVFQSSSGDCIAYKHSSCPLWLLAFQNTAAWFAKL